MPLVFPMQLVIWLIFAFLVAWIAYQRGRNPMGWFLLGGFMGCLALILVLILPDLQEERKHRERERRARERLREQVLQERMKNQAFREHAQQRLDSHDEALGLDTRSSAPPELPPSPPAPSSATEIPLEGWYLAEAGAQPQGPFSLREVQERIESGLVGPQSLVWQDSLADWTTIARSPLAPFLP